MTNNNPLLKSFLLHVDPEEASYTLLRRPEIGWRLVEIVQGHRQRFAALKSVNESSSSSQSTPTETTIYLREPLGPLEDLLVRSLVESENNNARRTSKEKWSVVTGRDLENNDMTGTIARLSNELPCLFQTPEPPLPYRGSHDIVAWYEDGKMELHGTGSSLYGQLGEGLRADFVPWVCLGPLPTSAARIRTGVGLWHSVIALDHPDGSTSLFITGNSPPVLSTLTRDDLNIVQPKASTRRSARSSSSSHEERADPSAQRWDQLYSTASEEADDENNEGVGTVLDSIFNGWRGGRLPLPVSMRDDVTSDSIWTTNTLCVRRHIPDRLGCQLVVLQSCERKECPKAWRILVWSEEQFNLWNSVSPFDGDRCIIIDEPSIVFDLNLSIIQKLFPGDFTKDTASSMNSRLLLDVKMLSDQDGKYINLMFNLTENILET